MIDEQPYTTADEDPFNVQPLLQQPRHRRSSMLNKWIQEQQKQPFTFNDFFNPTEDPSLLPPTTSAYLAYPTFGRAALHPDDTRDDIVSLNSYDLVEDDDIPQNLPGRSEVRRFVQLIFRCKLKEYCVDAIHTNSYTFSAHF